MRFLVVAAALAALAGCARSAVPAGEGGRTDRPDSGIRGTVVLGPRCPVATVERPCPDTPFEATVQVRAGTGDVVATFVSGTDGRFEVALRPGHYVLQGLAPESDEPFPFAKPVDVTVRPHAFTEATVSFDTGIR